MLREFAGKHPRLGEKAWVDASAQVIGDVDLGAAASVWMGAIVRGDVNSICIGDRSNIQDLCVAHVTYRVHKLHIGTDVTVGHHAVVHGCHIGDRVLVGIGARILDGAIIESDCMVAAGAVVAPKMRVPSGSLVMGVPARVVRPLRDDERDHIKELALRYVQLAEIYAGGEQTLG